MTLRALLTTLLLFVPPAHEPSRHPQDGPDIDLRMRVAQERVSFQAVVNLAFCDEIVDIGRLDLETLHPSEEGALRDALRGQFDESLQIAIDGVPRTADEVDFEVLPVDESTLAFFPNYGLAAATKIRLHFAFECPDPPTSVSLTWRLFPPDRAMEPMVEQAISAKVEWSAMGDVEIVELTEFEPQFTWHAPDRPWTDGFLAVPEPMAPTQRQVALLPLLLGAGGVLIAVMIWRSASRRGARIALGGAVIAVCGAAAFVVDERGGGPWRLAIPYTSVNDDDLDRDGARRVFETLHANVYRAFDADGEAAIYDALERSIDGPLLDRVYDEVYQSLVMREEGGAVARVTEVVPIETAVGTMGKLPGDGGTGFSVEARWQVTGEVFHWGHTHTRRNAYHARYTVAETDRGWRIVDNQMLEQNRVDLEPPR